MKEYQVMLDLETMSTAYNAAICSIGAVRFSEEDGIEDEFYQTVDLKDCKRLGLDIDKNTVEWWGRQPKEALQALQKNTISLHEALTKFSKWFGVKSLPVWGNGATFDNVIITTAYQVVGLLRPWKYWDDRCYRTLNAIVDIPKTDWKGVYHNALDDARNQTEHLLQILRS